MSIKQLMRRAAVVMIALVVAGCQVGGANPSPAAPAGSQTGLASGGAQKLVVGYVALNATQLPSWVAKEQGIFDKNGLDVDLQYLQGGSSPTAALLSGQVQVLVAAEQAIQATLNGADLVYIAAPTSTIFFSLYARPEITDGASLKGKKIGITQTGSATHTAARMAARNLGLDPDQDVTMLNIGSAPNILAALQNGAVDAGVLSSPTSLQARAAGMRELVNVAKIGDPFPSGWAAASRKYVADHADAIQRYVKAIAEAVAFELKNPEQTQQILARYVKSDDSSITREAYDEVAPYLKKSPTPDAKAVQTALDELSSTLAQARSAEPGTFIDMRFADDLESSGFIKSLYP